MGFLKKQNDSETFDFGIDLGTEHSCIAMFDGSDTIIIPNKIDNKNFVSSAVYIKKNGTLLVGDSAKNKTVTDPKNGCIDFKLKMGSDYIYEFETSGRRMTPVELSAEILKYLRKNVKTMYQEDLREAVITVPVDFNVFQTKATIEAGELAGLNEVRLMHEPTAAAMAYGFGNADANKIWLIYDFGESTFDVSILKKTENDEIVNISNSGDAYLGGRFIDWDIVYRILTPAVIDELGLTDFERDNPKYIKQFAKLKKAAETAKTDLSIFGTAEIEIENFFISEDSDIYDFEYDMNREELESIMEPYVNRTLNHCHKALDDINLSISDVTKIILVGSSTLSPYIHKRLTEEFNIPLEYSIDPTTVVARGAALFAGTQIKKTKNHKYLDVDDVAVIDKPLEITDEEPIENDNVNDEPTQPRNFKYLDDLIHSGVKEIVLDSDIVLGSDEESQYLNGIKLDVDDLTIDGKGHAIDARGLTRIFYCTGKNIIIKNIILKKGFTKDDGGAINNNEGELTITESTLQENTTKGSGGAINNDKGELTITESTLNNNTAHRYGGAIHNDKGELTITESTLTENTAQSEYGGGGAINNDKGELTITESTLTENTAKFGGTINNYMGELTITKSTLTENTAKKDGGAINNNEGELTITKSTLNENTTKENGGAITNKGEITITESTLNNNIAKEDGGAISHWRGELTITKSTITENTAKQGGAVATSKGGELTITDSMLSKNMAKENGGAIYHHIGDFKIFNSIFSNNKSVNNIIHNYDSLQVYNSNFIGNHAENLIVNDNDDSESTSFLHVLDAYTILSNLSIFNGEFKDNYIEESIILNKGKLCTIEKTIFENNHSNTIINKSDLTLINPKIKDDGKTILNENHIIIRNSSKELESKIYGEGTVENRSIFQFKKFDFTYLDKKIHESNTQEIILDHDITFENYEIDYYEGGIELDIDNLIIDGNGHTIDAQDKTRIFYCTGKSITIKNLTLKNGHSHHNYDNSINNNGGAIKINHNTNLNIKNCKFINNFSGMSGGAIENGGDLTIKKSSFNENTSNLNGGSIVNSGTLTIIESIFQENIANVNGGVIDNYGDLTIIGSAITGNMSTAVGAIKNDGKLTIRDSTLNENTAKSIGAISNKGELTISESTLKNTSQESCGAILNLGTLTIRESTLNENISQEDSGAIVNKGELIIFKSIFNKNSATHAAGAIYNFGTINVAKLTVTESYFNENTAGMSGGAISNNGGVITIDKSIFNKNTAQYGGAINNDKPNRYRSEIHISESIFDKNIAEMSGGAIFNQCELGITGSAFNENMFLAVTSLGFISTSECTFKDNKPYDVYKEKE